MDDTSKRAELLDHKRAVLATPVRSIEHNSKSIIAASVLALVLGAFLVRAWHKVFALEVTSSNILNAMAAASLFGLIVGAFMHLRSTIRTRTLLFQRLFTSSLLGLYVLLPSLCLIALYNRMSNELFHQIILIGFIYLMMFGMGGFLLYGLFSMLNTSTNPRYGLRRWQLRDDPPSTLLDIASQTTQSWMRDELYEAVIMKGAKKELLAVARTGKLSEAHVSLWTCRVLEDFILEREAILEEALPHMRGEERKAVITTWERQHDRIDLAPVLCAIPEVARNSEMASKLVPVMHDIAHPGAVEAALTLLSSSRKAYHDLALDYLEAIPLQAHTEALLKVYRRGVFSPGTAARFNTLLEGSGEEVVLPEEGEKAPAYLDREIAQQHRQERLDAWQKRVFANVRVHRFEEDLSVQGLGILSAIATIIAVAVDPYSGLVSLIDELPIVLIGLASLGVLNGLRMELTSSTTTTYLTINRMLGSIMYALAAGGIGIGVVAVVHDIGAFAEGFGPDSLIFIVVSWFMFTMLTSLLLVILFRYVLGHAAYVPGATSSRAQHMNTEHIRQRVNRAKDVRIAQEYMHALAMHEDFSDFTFLWEKKTLSPIALEISLLKAFDQMPIAQLNETLHDMLRSIPSELLPDLVKLWAEQDDRELWREPIIAASHLQVEMASAVPLLLTQLEDERDGAQRAAFTVLSSSRLDLHDEALDYLEKFARAEDAMALHNIKVSSKNPLLTRRVEALLERLGERLDKGRGGLSLAADASQQGALTTVSDEVEKPS